MFMQHAQNKTFMLKTGLAQFIYLNRMFKTCFTQYKIL